MHVEVEPDLLMTQICFSEMLSFSGWRSDHKEQPWILQTPLPWLKFGGSKPSMRLLASLLGLTLYCDVAENWPSVETLRYGGLCQTLLLKHVPEMLADWLN